jgi:hypothetical protein
MSIFNEPRIVAGCKMPTDKSISASDQYERDKARIGSEMLAQAIERYRRKWERR